jgi:hypothetical protein
MTEDKARKRAIRRRMQKTGERYTAARRRLEEPRPPVADPGMSDQAVRKGSGKGWDEWYGILDAWGAQERSHTEIARHVNEEHGVPGWWSQTVAVGYERARGMRAVGQQTDGFSVGVTKTVPVNVHQLFEAFADAGLRRRWLEQGTLRTRTLQPGRSARFDFRDGATRVHAYFEEKGPEKASVVVQHERLADPDAREEARAFWKDRLRRLTGFLSP